MQDIWPSHVRRLTSHIHAITAACKDLLSVVIPLDYTPCPASDLAHSFSSSGRERSEEREVWKNKRVTCGSLEKWAKCKMFPINGEKVAVGGGGNERIKWLVWFPSSTPPPVPFFTPLFCPISRSLPVESRSRYWILTKKHNSNGPWRQNRMKKTQ